MIYTNAVLILPVAQRAAGDALSIAMGHADADVSTYAVPLVPIGESEPTHFACHAWVRDDFRATIEAAQGGIYPAWPSEMLALAQAVIPHLIAEFAGEPGIMVDLAEIAAAHGLERPPAVAPQ